MYDAFDCVLRILVIQLTLLLLHPIVGHSIDSCPEFRSIDLVFLNHSIDLFLCDHSIVSSSWNHSIASINMPVTTRSMTKRLLFSDIVCQAATSVPCDTAMMNDSVLSSSSLDRGPPPVLHSVFQNFEISNFQESSNFSEKSTADLSHNSSLFQNRNMESDCEEQPSPPMNHEDSSATNQEILKMPGAISSQMMIGHQDLQHQNSMLTAELQKVVADTNMFKQEMRNELLHLQQSSNTLSSVPVISSLTPTPVISSPGALNSSTVVSTQASSTNTQALSSQLAGSNSSVNFQMQMLTLLNNMFTQLTTVINETKTVIGEAKTSDSNSDWPKFSGDTKKFRHWYLGIMSQISISP